MPTVIMPKMGDAMEEGTVVKWLKAEGDTVAKDEPLVEIETDKATLELTAEYAGTLSKRIAGEGESVAIGKPIATITGEGESPEPPPSPKPPPRRSKRRRLHPPKRRASRRLHLRPKRLRKPRPPVPVTGSRRRRWRAGSPRSTTSICARYTAAARAVGSSARMSRRR